jgi:hypothetical protein
MLPENRPQHDVGWPRATQTSVAILGALAFGALAYGYGYGVSGGRTESYPQAASGSLVEEFWRSDLNLYDSIEAVTAAVEFSENFAGACFDSLTLVTTDTTTAFGTNYMRAWLTDISPSSDCWSGTMVFAPTDFSGVYDEVWLEVWYRFADNWKGVVDHKWIYNTGSPSGRWSIKPAGSGTSTDKVRLRVAGSGAASEIFLDTDSTHLETRFWTGNWHRLRCHMKKSTDDVTDDGLFRCYVDGVWLDPTQGPYNNDDGLSIVTDTVDAVFTNFVWGGTVSPCRLVSCGGGTVWNDFGEIAIWTTAPGDTTWLQESR